MEGRSRETCLEGQAFPSNVPSNPTSPEYDDAKGRGMEWEAKTEQSRGNGRDVEPIDLEAEQGASLSPHPKCIA